MSMTMENIIEKYETTFGNAVVLIPSKVYAVGDEIYTKDGKHKIKSIIPPTRPEKTGRITFIID